MTKRKRIGFTIGVMLLMGGWGLTWYADEQQQAYPTSATQYERLKIKSSGVYPRGNRWRDGVWIIYAAGIMLITVGAGVTAFNLPLPEGWK